MATRILASYGFMLQDLAQVPNLVDFDLEPGRGDSQDVGVRVGGDAAAGGALAARAPTPTVAARQLQAMAKAMAAVRLPTPSMPVNSRAWGMVPWVRKERSVRTGRS